MNAIVNLRNWTVETVRKPKVGFALGLGLSMLAGAPMPLPQLALLGPWLAASAVGAMGARSGAAVGLVSFVLFGHPNLLTGVLAAAIALAIGLGLPKLMAPERASEGTKRTSDGGASAMVIDCDGFSSLDDTYGHGSSDHVFRLLRRALEVETRNTDLVVNARGRELILILDGSSPEVARSVMKRVEQRFGGWLSDAGYECNLTVGLADMDESEAEFDSLLRATRRFDGERYLD